MSHSFKHNPIYTDGRDGQVISKRFANKAVRNYKHKIANGKAYKHLFCSYNIHDFTIRWTWQEAKHKYENDATSYLRLYSNIKELYKYWSKNHRRK